MAMKSQMNDAYQEIYNCRNDVDRATVAYSKGSGSVTAVNRANRALADATQRLNEVLSGRVTENR
ncbi:hypothetical protein [Bradyrhizobium guangzhouense]|uniref:hypothetical protein n=1 Tax=Bradyrhizobium guangzhouense TaxID=1325095 RepID=UPI0010099B45|nr:hypothetical protein [Bradyrhizobium guangzhouense]RXH15228.1 hypothetical protein EAS54_19320 [Bradyrhizobium guangzhouense]